MIGTAIRAKLAPYALALKLGLLVLAFGVGFQRGCSVQQGRDQERMDKMAAQLREDAATLRNVARVLKASSSVLRIVNTESQARIARAEKERRDLAKAGQVAEQAWQAAEARSRQLASDLATAKARKPGCAELLATDLEAVCGIKPR